MSGQGVLFEPTGAEVGPLALMHAKKAQGYAVQSDVCSARGWVTLSRQCALVAAEHNAEAECLAMLADFERLAGIK